MSLRLICGLVALVLATPAWAKNKNKALDLSFEGASEHVYKKIGNVSLKMWVFSPEGHQSTDKKPAAVFFFGGGWNGGTPAQFEPHARYLASRGMVAAVADYRVKSRQGTTPFECVKDGKSAVRYLRKNTAKLGIDPNRIAAGGGSAGGHVAAATGTVPGLEEAGEDQKVSSKPDALLLFNPVYDNGPDGYGHVRVKGRWKQISPMHNITRGAPPTIVFLGSKDKLIPVKTAVEYKKRMEAVGARCDNHIYEGQGHGFFNKSKSGGLYYRKTVFEMDKFLASLGWLQGDPTIDQAK
ncbi:MAG: alpha/beta hydrolase [Phycisphaeraceae bacterium]|nr:alpha/beta hydrolase [Phycisphaeraceae bacterium]